MLLRRRSSSIHMQLYMTFRGRKHAGQNTQQRRFACTIRACYGETVAALYLYREPSEQYTPTEALSYFAGDEPYGREHVSRPNAWTLGAGPPRRYLG